MIIGKHVSLIFPSQELGRKIAQEDCRTQSQVLEGFASQQLLNSVYNSQTIINLVAVLPEETILWFIKVYQETLRQKRIPKEVTQP